MKQNLNKQLKYHGIKTQNSNINFGIHLVAGVCQTNGKKIRHLGREDRRYWPLIPIIGERNVKTISLYYTWLFVFK